VGLIREKSASARWRRVSQGIGNRTTIPSTPLPYLLEGAKIFSERQPIRPSPTLPVAPPPIGRPEFKEFKRPKTLEEIVGKDKVKAEKSSAKD
jgi:hypothetical protein